MNKHDYGEINVVNYGPNMTMEDAPELKKLGVVGMHGEMTPIVYEGKLCMVTTIRENGVPCGMFCEVNTQKEWSKFGAKREFYSALMNTLLVSIVAIAFILPLVWMVTSSVKTTQEVFSTNWQWLPKVWRWDNYATVWIMIFLFFRGRESSWKWMNLANVRATQL